MYIVHVENSLILLTNTCTRTCHVLTICSPEENLKIERNVNFKDYFLYYVGLNPLFNLI